MSCSSCSALLFWGQAGVFSMMGSIQRLSGLWEQSHLRQVWCCFPTSLTGNQTVTYNILNRDELLRDENTYELAGAK